MIRVVVGVVRCSRVLDWVVDWVGVVRYPRERRGVGSVLIEGYLELGVGSGWV